MKPDLDGAPEHTGAQARRGEPGTAESWGEVFRFGMVTDGEEKEGGMNWGSKYQGKKRKVPEKRVLGLNNHFSAMILLRASPQPWCSQVSKQT